MNAAEARTGGKQPNQSRPQGAVVEQALPQGLYRVSLENGDKVIASLGGVARQTVVRVLPGDRVTVEISPFDPTRGRIVGKA